MKDLYETLKSIMSEVTSPRAHIQEVTVKLNSKGKLAIQASWSDNFHTKLQLNEEQAKAPDAEFHIKKELRKERRDNEGANQGDNYA